MKEIKFRAWDKDENYMRGWELLQRVYYGSPMEDNIFNDADYILMQYTGLKDKNGVEIYEGDIVRDLFTCMAMGDCPEEPRTKDPIEVKIPDIYYRMEFMGYMPDLDFEIIGNIYDSEHQGIS